IVVVLGVMADRLAVLRPVWRWARSLPSTSRRRVVEDAAYLAAVALPVIVGAAIVAPLSAFFAAIALPGAAVRAPGALRRGGAGRLGGTSSFFLEGMLGAVAFALSPWAVVAVLAATPWWLKGAERDEARLPVSRFAPILHHASGDPASWTGR